MFIYQKVKLK